MKKFLLVTLILVVSVVFFASYSERLSDDLVETISKYENGESVFKLTDGIWIAELNKYISYKINKNIGVTEITMAFDKYDSKINSENTSKLFDNPYFNINIYSQYLLKEELLKSVKEYQSYGIEPKDKK